MRLEMSEEKPKTPDSGHPTAFDPSAKSRSQTEPAFVARPEDAPVYDSFQTLSDVVVDGFTFGKISDFEAELCSEGDAFVVAPDNSRAGLVWEVCEENYFREIVPFEPGRWGVWGVSFPFAMQNHDNVRRNLKSILPELKKRWQEWRRYSIPDNATSCILANTGGVCPRCQMSFSNHQYRLIAATVLKSGKLGSLSELMEAIRTQHWQKVFGFQDWEGTQANAEVFALRCPNDGLSLAVVRSPFSLNEPYILLHRQTVDENAEMLLRELPNYGTWRSF
jgi:hypothetical protein